MIIPWFGLTRDNAYWILLVLASFAAFFTAALVRPIPRRTPLIDWDAPATDLDDAETATWSLIGHATPVVWSSTDNVYVCAAAATGMPQQICGWPATASPCPDHGPLVIPTDTHTRTTGGAR